MDLQGKTVLVTGASSGIGRAVAIAFAQKRAHVLVHYGKNKSGAQATLDEKQGDFEVIPALAHLGTAPALTDGSAPSPADGGGPGQALVPGNNATAQLIDVAQIQGQVHAQAVHRVGELAERNPKETASIVRQWLAEPAG